MIRLILQIIPIIILIFSYTLPIYAVELEDIDPEALAKDGLVKSQNMASSEESGNNIPGYSKEKADIHANDINQMDDAEMKSKSHQKMQSADEGSPEGIARDAMSTKTIEGYENQEIFTKAEKINEDPIAAFERMTNEGCKEKENEQKQIYKKVVKKELITDTEIYEETCERPAGNIICEKTLSVTCDNMSDCGYDSGGIVDGSLDSGVEWGYSYPNLRVGKIGNAYWGGTCAVYDKEIRFNVKDVSLVKEFTLKEVGADDHIRITVNGSQVFIGPMDGYKLDLVWERHAWFGKIQKVDTGRGVHSCELNQERYFYPNKDLRPYLRNGENVLRMKVIVTGTGIGWMKLRASQYCCRSFTDKWEKRCWNE